MLTLFPIFCSYKAGVNILTHVISRHMCICRINSWRWNHWSRGSGIFHRSFDSPKCLSKQAVLIYINFPWLPVSPSIFAYYSRSFLFRLLCGFKSFDCVLPRLFIIFLLVCSSSLYILDLKLHHRYYRHFSQFAACLLALWWLYPLKIFPFFGCQISIPFLLWPLKMTSQLKVLKTER